MKSYIKVPMIAAVILEALVLFMSLIMYLNQDKILRNITRMNLNTGKVFPAVITLYIIMLIVYIIFFLVMASYDGASCRGVGNAMMVAWIIFNIASPYVNSITNSLAARKGSDQLAALGVLSSQITMYVAPISVIASALALMAIGRFSVESEYREAAPAGINPAVFGQGYMPVQGAVPFQGYTPTQTAAPFQGYTPAEGSAPTQNTDQGQGQ